jgi:predicted transcriptional regulator
MEIVTIRLDKSLKTRLLAYCEKNDRSVSNTVRIALRDFLQQEEHP